MAVKNLGLAISDDRIPIKGDVLASDCLSIECMDKIVLAPNTKTQLNISVRNTSNVGRMANLYALYDHSIGIRVQFGETKVYVAPDGKTTTFVLIETLMNSRGNCNITIGVS